MKDMEIKDLKPGDIFLENDYYRPKIVESLRIVEEMNLVYVMFRFIGEDGGVRRTYDIYDTSFNVYRLPI